MKKSVLIVALIVLGGVLAGCGGQKTDLAIGQELARDGNCADAVAYFEATIAQTEDIMDLAHAYYAKGLCAEKAGDIPSAYKNLYAARIVACYAVAHDTEANLNTYARSEFCEKIIPEKLAKLTPDAGDTKAIQAKVKETLTERYLKRFVTE